MRKIWNEKNILLCLLILVLLQARSLLFSSLKPSGWVASNKKDFHLMKRRIFIGQLAEIYDRKQRTVPLSWEYSISAVGLEH